MLPSAQPRAPPSAPCRPARLRGRPRLPWPDHLTPPNGLSAPPIMWLLMPTMPGSSSRRGAAGALDVARSRHRRPGRRAGGSPRRSCPPRSVGVDQRDRAERLLVHDVRVERNFGRAPWARRRSPDCRSARRRCRASRPCPSRCRSADPSPRGGAALAIGPICVPSLEAVADTSAPWRRSAKPSRNFSYTSSCTMKRVGLTQTWPQLRYLAADRGLERLVDIGIVEHQHRAVAAEFHRRPLHVLGGELGEVLADHGRAGEADSLRMIGLASRWRLTSSGTPNTACATSLGRPAS